MFPDSVAQQYPAVIIVHSVFDLSDEDGHRYLLLELLEDIVGYGKTASDTGFLFEVFEAYNFFLL